MFETDIDSNATSIAVEDVDLQYGMINSNQLLSDCIF